MRYPIKMLEDRKHVVVPVVMLVEGVARGSNGALLYTKNEMEKAAHLWNGRIVCIYHPEMEGGGAGAAGNPSVFSRQRVGVIFNARMEKRALKADAWLDVEHLKRLSPRVADAVKRGEMVEVSTGLFTDKEGPASTFNGIPYTAVAVNHIPDHLAILPDQIGACSIAMGAGLCRNRAVVDEEAPLVAPVMSFA